MGERYDREGTGSDEGSTDTGVARTASSGGELIAARQAVKDQRDRAERLEADVARIRQDQRGEREAASRTNMAQAAELGHLLNRVATEERNVGRLESEIAALHEQLEQARNEAAAQDLEKIRLTGLIQSGEIEISRLLQEREPDRPSARVSGDRSIPTDLAQLRGRVDELERQAGASELARLRRVQTEVLASLSRPAPVGPSRADSIADRDAHELLATAFLFDPEWYGRLYPDVITAGLDPIAHYLDHGWKEGRQPSAGFDGDHYLLANPDVAKSGVNPLIHYLRHGAREGRAVGPAGLSGPLGAVRSAGEADVCRGEPRLWFFVGDTIDWLTHHHHLTGVGRVTAELLIAAAGDRGSPIRICARGASPTGLTRATPNELITDLVRLAGHPAALAAELKRGIRVEGATAPARGDHVIFTGLVWTNPFKILFRQLAAVGVTFSVLIHDIIPILEPELCGEEIARSFAEWLDVTLSTASVVYTSNRVVGEHLRRWMIGARLLTDVRIERIEFGVNTLPVHDRSDAGAGVLDSVARNYALSVGTIDTRKNQRLLVRLWTRMLDRLAEEDLPQLVLVGRDDLGLGGDLESQRLLAAGKLVVLQELDDGDVATLYQNCAFTVFPSLSEGYGMPVAESLAYGKLCIASDLAVIRAHAGDLVWYFDPADEETALALIERAIGTKAQVEGAEADIARLYRPPSWAGAFATIRAAVADLPLAGKSAALPLEPSRYAGSVSESSREILGRAQTWCSSDNPDVSILIINWNAASLTRDCIRQIWAKSEGMRYEIVIVDNGSAESDRSRLRGLGEGIMLIEAGCNRFYGEANNIAAEAASGTYLCLLNNDAFPEEGWLEELVRPIRENADVGATGPLFRFPDGRIQEAGAIVDPDGYPIRFARGEIGTEAGQLEPKLVDYISAAALMIERELFLKVGGFDLAYEPAYYEDTDLCFKVRAFGRSVLFCPAARVTHIEGSASNGNLEAERRRQHLGDLNRAKFVARWGKFLTDRDAASLAAVQDTLQLPAKAKAPKRLFRVVNAPSAVVYTPYPLTMGGGERYLLTIATLLADTHAVTLVTPHPYSRVRLRLLGAGLGLDLEPLQLLADPTLDKVGTPDIQIVMGNHIAPPVAARGKLNIYHCQFPFPGGEQSHRVTSDLLAAYDKIVVNSRYTALHVEAVLNGRQLPGVDIAVLPPPVIPVVPGTKVPNRILTVGRFFVGGHSKRHDRLIEAFRKLADRVGDDVELHIVGSSTPEPRHMDYLAALMGAAAGQRIQFHINASAAELAALYGSASFYWHGTGLDADLTHEPYAAEHFGIALVEAMSAGAIPFALGSGGPREIIQHGINGFLYDSVDTLVEKTERCLALPQERRTSLMDSAMRRAHDFSYDRFAERLRQLLRGLDERSDGNDGSHRRGVGLRQT